MKNLSISKKLIVGFGIVLILMLASIAIAFYSINSISTQVETYAQYTVPNNSSLWSMRRDLVSAERNVLRAFNADSVQKAQEELDLAQKDGQALVETLDAYAKNQRNTDRDEQIKEVGALLEQAGTIRYEIGDLILNPTEENLQKANDLLKINIYLFLTKLPQSLWNFPILLSKGLLSKELRLKRLRDWHGSCSVLPLLSPLC